MTLSIVAFDILAQVFHSLVMVFVVVIDVSVASVVFI